MSTKRLSIKTPPGGYCSSVGMLARMLLMNSDVALSHDRETPQIIENHAIDFIYQVLEHGEPQLLPRLLKVLEIYYIKELAEKYIIISWVIRKFLINLHDPMLIGVLKGFLKRHALFEVSNGCVKLNPSKNYDEPAELEVLRKGIEETKRWAELIEPFKELVDICEKHYKEISGLRFEKLLDAEHSFIKSAWNIKKPIASAICLQPLHTWLITNAPQGYVPEITHVELPDKPIGELVKDRIQIYEKYESQGCKAYVNQLKQRDPNNFIGRNYSFARFPEFPVVMPVRPEDFT